MEAIDINEIFARNLRRARLKEGLSQEKLAELAGLHRTYVSAVERGERNISLRNVQRLATALKMTSGELLKVYPQD